MAKRKFMICYDISDDNRRNKVIAELLRFGIRTQYSVFEAVLSDKDLKYLKRKISKIIYDKEDSVFFYPLSEKSYKKVIRVGSRISYLPVDDIFV